jgi:hypothetical protein
LSTNFKKEKPKIKLFPRRAEECKTEHFPGAWNERAGDLLGEGNTKLLALPSSSTILPRSRRRSRRAVATSHSIRFSFPRVRPCPRFQPYSLSNFSVPIRPSRRSSFAISVFPPPEFRQTIARFSVLRLVFAGRTSGSVLAGDFPLLFSILEEEFFLGANASMCLPRMRARVFFSSPDGFWVDSAVEP